MFDARTLGQLEKLFDLQMWAFGCDARRAEGNLFAARGMRRTAPPTGSALSATWSETVADCDIGLSSAGVTLRVGDRQLVLQRGPLGPQLRGTAAELLPRFAKWVLDWESWVDREAGLGWRPQTLAQRRRPAPWSEGGLRAAWRELSEAPGAGGGVGAAIRFQR